jgi:hypothetical protein
VRTSQLTRFEALAQRSNSGARSVGLTARAPAKLAIVVEKRLSE